MSWEAFREPGKKFSIVLFVQDEVLARRKEEFEELGELPNVRLVVQPCPYEAIEFLYRVAHQLYGHKVSMDKDLFWHALVLRKNPPEAAHKMISDHHHKYLCAILEQDAPAVEKEGRILKSLVEASS